MFVDACSHIFASIAQHDTVPTCALVRIGPIQRLPAHHPAINGENE